MKAYKHADDRELLRRFWGGESSAFDELVRKHRVRLMEAVMRVIRDRDAAQDVYQDVLIRIHALLSAQNYREEGKFLPWATRIARNMAVDVLRKRRRGRVERAPLGIEDVVAGGELPDQHIVCNEIHRDLRKLLNFLPKNQREVIVLRVYNRMTFKEIAEFTDCSINTALGRMRYAVENLRKQVKRFPAVYF